MNSAIFSARVMLPPLQRLRAVCLTPNLVAQYALEHLARRIARQRIADVQLARHLEARKVLPAVVAQPVVVELPRPDSSTTTATGRSPHCSSGTPDHRHSLTVGHGKMTRSTSEEAMFSPPEMIMSFLRSVRNRKPSSSR